MPRPAGVLGSVPPRGRTGTARCRRSVHAVHRADGGPAMTEPHDVSAEDVGSRAEAAMASVRHERAEAAEEVGPREHVTAAAGTEHPHIHHPDDPNDGVVVGRPGRGALLAAFVAAAITTVGVVL